MQGLLGDPGPAPDILTVHVRRGDYYSVPVHRGIFSFDIHGHLEVALPRAVNGGHHA